MINDDEETKDGMCVTLGIWRGMGGFERCFKDDHR